MFRRRPIDVALASSLVIVGACSDATEPPAPLAIAPPATSPLFAVVPRSTHLTNA